MNIDMYVVLATGKQVQHISYDNKYMILKDL